MAKNETTGLLAKVKPLILGQTASAVKMQTLDIYQHLSFHVDGYSYNEGKIDNPYFEKLITSRRPNESANIQAYRKTIYLPKTKQPCFKVLNSLKKIAKSQDWAIDYSKAVTPKVVGDETLEQYCEKDYPIFKSLENWLYSFATKEIIKDPNGLIYIDAKDWDVEAGEKIEPVAKFIKTPNVLYYKENDYALFLSDMVNTITDKEGKNRNLPIYVYITKTSIIYIKEVNIGRDLTYEVKTDSNTEMFCFKAGGVFSDIVKGEAIYNSFIDPMLPSLDATARESSDLNAEVVQHIYSTMWYYSGNDCRACNGTGLVKSNQAGFGVNKEGQQTACPKCEGGGRMLKSPYKDIVVGKEGMGENGVPTPPAGYIQKTTDIVTLQDTRIEKHIFEALSSLNMEFLAQTPLNQSGTAKEVDRDELNNFVYSVAYHLVENVLVNIYRMTNDMRYGVLVKDVKERKEMLPSIPVPEKFDLLSTNTVVDNYKKAKESGLDNSIVDEIEVDIINKIFNSQPDVRNKLLLVKNLDPLRAHDEEDKLELFNTGIISKEDFVISTYLSVFVDNLLIVDPEFFQKELKDQFEQIKKLANLKITELDKVQEIKNELGTLPVPNLAEND